MRFTEIFRAVNASLEPERVAEAMIAGIADWIPVSGWLVLANDEAGQPAALRLPA